MRAIFSAHIHTDRGAYQTSCTVGVRSLLRGAKRPGRGIDYPPSSNAEVKERVELYLYSFYGPSWAVNTVNVMGNEVRAEAAVQWAQRWAVLTAGTEKERRIVPRSCCCICLSVHAAEMLVNWLM